jgi:hypothetical protein
MTLPPDVGLAVHDDGNRRHRWFGELHVCSGSLQVTAKVGTAAQLPHVIAKCVHDSGFLFFAWKKYLENYAVSCRNRRNDCLKREKTP